MGLAQQMEEIVECYKGKAQQLAFNRKMIDIYEGNIGHYLHETLKANLHPKAYESLKDRIVPINLLRRMVDKMSKIYQRGVVRRVVGGGDADGEMLAEYEERMRFDDRMNGVNEYYNMFKYALGRPVAYAGRVNLMPVANDRYFVMSKDPVDPMRVTHIVYIDRVESGRGGEDIVVFHAYTDDEFLIFDSQLQIRVAEMASYQNGGVNPFGVLDAQYFNRSTNYLMPKPDQDLLWMIILVPILLTDLAYAIKFQSFSITYGVDLDFENLERSPNAIWLFKTDKKMGDDSKPEIGTIKPEVDIDQVLRFTQSTLAMFLQSRGIRPGIVGQLTVDNFSSGISKMIDEMDTFEDRNAQIATFKPGEIELCNKIVHRLHPVWRAQGSIDISHTFTPKAYVQVEFPEQIPMQDRGQLVTDQDNEVKAGFTTRRRAIKKLNPAMSDEEIDQLMAEIDEEKAARAAMFAVPAARDETNDGENQDEAV